MNDRRKHQRFKLGDACIINHNTTVGTIINISMGGLSCGCLDKDQCNKDLSPFINIYCKMFDIQAEDISMKVLDSVLFPGKSSEDIRYRICRCMFSQLDKFQELQLKNLIVRSSLST